MQLRNNEIHKLVCVKCMCKALPMYVPRKKDKLREAGHLKKCYCCSCGEETNHAEVTETGGYTNREFYLEWAYNNFDENGNRKQPWRMFVNEIRSKNMKELSKPKKEELNG